MKRFRVKYQVNDGYVGKDRPLYFHISDSDIDDDMCDEDLEELFMDKIQDDFEYKVSPEGENFEEFLEWANEIQDDRKNKE